MTNEPAIWTDGLVVLAGLLSLAVGFWLLHRWKWPAVAAFGASALALILALRRRAPAGTSPGGEAHRQARKGALERKAEALVERERARRAAEAAARVAHDVDAAGDLDALVDHAIRESRGQGER